jgi:DNA-binding NarL/FixJ family response regulator
MRRKNHRAKILCIEDDRETAALIAEELVDRGFDVSIAHSGEEGLLASIRATPDLIRCDVGMPTMTGFEVLERLNEITPKIGRFPFVFLTALADRESELKGRELGANDYVAKPIDFDRLDFIIRARLADVPRTGTLPKLPKAALQLREREIEVLTWVARGNTSAEIATKLRLTKRTVDFHADNARIKLGAATRTEAAIKAARTGLINP